MHDDVLCLRKCKCDESDDAVESSAGKRADAYGDVLFLRKCKCEECDDAVGSSSGGKQMQAVYACVVISWVLALDIVSGERGSSASGRMQVLGLHACELLAFPWSSRCWLARSAIVAALLDCVPRRTGWCYLRCEGLLVCLERLTAARTCGSSSGAGQTPPSRSTRMRRSACAVQFPAHDPREPSPVPPTPAPALQAAQDHDSPVVSGAAHEDAQLLQ